MTPACAPGGRGRWAEVRLIPVLLSVFVVCTCAPSPGRRSVEFRGPTMGTTFSVKVVTGPDGPIDLNESVRAAVDESIRSQLARVDALMSTWDPESELSRFNRSTSLEPFAISRETFEVFQQALDLGALTNGALDVTVGPLIDAWGFGPGGQGEQPPAEQEIARLREAVGPQHLELDASASTVRKTRPDVRCELSAVAPGYAADRLSALLSEWGFVDFLVDVGGEMRARGRNDAGMPWQIAIEQPDERGRTIGRIIPVSDLAVATSGDYRQYYEVDGKRMAHILDPRVGRPIQHGLASVTVLDDLAVRADGLSTALMVLGPDEGFALAERLDLAALFIMRDDSDGFMERATRRFDALTEQ